MVFKFKKGDKVEVLMKKELPCSTWRCAELTSGNGHTYGIRFVDSLGGGDQRMARKFIRPSPPQCAAKDWVSGDIVEIFDNMSWKAALVSEAIDDNQYLVTLLGSSKEVRVHKSLIRVRQIWICDDWVVLGIARSSLTDWRCYQHKMKKRKLREEEEGMLVKRERLEELMSIADSVHSSDYIMASRDNHCGIGSNESADTSSSSSESDGNCEYIITSSNVDCGYKFDLDSESSCSSANESAA